MNQLLSPKQVAQALGVSESSLKRWCDKGLLATSRTAGGHRRLPAEAVIRFLRETGHAVVRPELLGLPSNVGRGDYTWDRSRALMVQALVEGDEEQCRRLIFDLYVNGRTAVDIGDRVVAAAFHEIGDRWHGGELEVYRERRACEVTQRALLELRGVLPPPLADAPLAIGGTLSGDEYKIPTLLVEIALSEVGWQAHSYGTSIPVATWLEALRDQSPRLFWLSVSGIDDLPEFLQQYDRLYSAALERGIAVAVGGRALTERVRRDMRFSTYCDNLQHLVAFAKTLYRPTLQQTPHSPEPSAGAHSLDTPC